MDGHPSHSASDGLENDIFEEWKVVQAKIDKIGGFRFHIKNWAFTITVALIVGGFVANAPWWVMFGALIPTWAFCFVEKRQQKILSVLMNRADRLERAMLRATEKNKTKEDLKARAKILGAAGTVPGLARDIGILVRSRNYSRWYYKDTTFYVALSLLILFAVGGALIRARDLSKKERQVEKQMPQINASITFANSTQNTFDMIAANLKKLEEPRASEQITLGPSKIEVGGDANPLGRYSAANVSLPEILSEPEFRLRLGIDCSQAAWLIRRPF
jgi:hypothetical protein